MSGAGDRAEAARLLARVTAQGVTTDQALGARSTSPLARELIMGSLRHYFSLTATVDRALHRPLKPADQDLRMLMVIGVYQLAYLRVPDHAAIHETVAACTLLGKAWARGLVNAVLRRAAREGPLAAGSEHPPWLEQALRESYPDADAIMAASNTQAPMAIRINTARIAPDAYLARLAATGIHSRPAAGGPGPETRVLLEPRPAESLPGYLEGLVAVQDAGAQFAARLLAPGPGERVLDACAAPGGKLFHLRERYPDAALTALERSAPRLAHLRSEAGRLGHEGVEIIEGDATGHDWWDGRSFHAVLLDAPCTGTGTLRRHPDVRVLRRAEDVPAMAELQHRLLSALWRVVEPGGTLLYCTCSILAAENDDVIARFIDGHADARPSPFELGTGRPTRYGWQLLPLEPDTDGFYYARMTRSGP